jgi:hypothetical protein
MQIYPIDPYQTDILNNIHSEEYLFIKGGSGTGKGYTIINALFQNILNGKSSVLIIDSEEDSTKFETLLSKFKLHEHSLILKSGNLAHTDLARIKSNYSFDASSENYAGVEILKRRLIFSRTEIVSSYYNFNQNIFGEMNLTQVIELYEQFQRAHGSTFLETYLNNEDFELNEKEFIEIKNVVSKCKQTFRKEYLEFESNNLFSSNIFNQKFDENNIQNIRNQFGDLYIELQGLRNLYIDYFASYKKNHSTKWNSQFNLLSKLRKEILFKIEELEFIGKLRDSKYSNPVKGISTHFTKEKNLLASKYDELHKVFLDFKQRLIKFGLFEGLPDLSKKETLPLPVIRDYMQSQENNFKNWKSIINKNIEENIKRLNKHNAEDLQLNNLESKLSFLIDRINKHNLFEEVFEDNALSSFKKFQFLEYLIQQLEFAFFQLQKLPGYYSWQHFWQALQPRSRKVINHLVKIDKKLWLSSFQSWYLKNIIVKYSHPDNPRSIKIFNEYFEQQEKFKDNLKNLIHLIWNEKRSKALEQLKTIDKVLYTTIFKKNSQLNWTWQTMLAKHPEFLIKAFPIIIINKLDILNSNAPLVSKWDFGLTYDIHFENKTEINIVKNLASKFSYFSRHEPTKELKKILAPATKGEKEAHTFELNILHCERSDKLSELSLRNRLMLAKQLASMLVCTNENIRIFHLKNSNFISTMSKEANEKLIHSFEDHGIKESKMHGEIEAGIVEVLLDTDKTNLLFLQNGLINPQQPESFHFQRSTLNYFKKAGIVEMNIWSLHLLTSPGSTFSLAQDFIQNLNKKEEDAVAV